MPQRCLGIQGCKYRATLREGVAHSKETNEAMSLVRPAGRGGNLPCGAHSCSHVVFRAAQRHVLPMV
jgi:hypothetical protein